VGSFELRVKRSTGAVAAAAPQTVVIKESPPPPPQPTDTVKSVDESVDESLVYVSSPKASAIARFHEGRALVECACVLACPSNVGNP